MFSLVSFAVCVASLLLFLLHRSSSKPPKYTLPPGPKSSWFSRVYVPKSHQWKTYTQWRKLYGDVIYLRVWQSPIIILNSRQAAQDLLEKRSAIYSSRTFRTMVNELMGWDWIFSSMPYGDAWRRHRRLFHQHFYPNAVISYRPIQLRETHTLLRNLMDDPTQLKHHIRRSAAAIVVMISYGYQIAPEGDWYVSVADQAFVTLAKAGTFGSYLVDYLPWLKHIPTWMPGSGFKRSALQWRQFSHAMVDRPFALVKQRMAAGTATPSLASVELDALSHDPDSHNSTTETVIRNVAAISYSAGADTTVSAIMSFFLAMALFPDIQKRAQDEVDHVVGTARLPDFEDRQSLPYVESIVWECLRWNPVVPLGLTHKVMQDDVYNGMHIPAETMVIGNTWEILHDEAIYPEPCKFNPDRFLSRVTGGGIAGINEYPSEAFGYGRRICPGRYLAESTIWITVVSLLAAFDISKAIDENGTAVGPDVEYTAGIISHPKPFKCTITPRSKLVASLIRETADCQY